MADVPSPSVRSFNMSQIRGKDTKPEILVRRFLHKKGFRFRLHDKNLPGKPDIVLKKYKSIIFIHGCFWHGHMECKYFKIPKTRTQWWLEKIHQNVERDCKNIFNLEANGWNVIVVWQCELTKDNFNSTLSKVIARLAG